MKPPYGNRPGDDRSGGNRSGDKKPGGAPRRPDQGPYRGGPSQGTPGRGFGGGPRQDARPGQASGKPSDAAPRDGQKARPNGGFQGQTPRSFRPREQESPRPSPDSPKGTVWLYGHHAVAAALSNPARRLRRLMLTEEGEAAIAKQLPPPWAVAPERVERGRLDQLLGRDIAHQGTALLADPLAPPSLQSVLEKPGVIIVLDQVTDPRNVGAIMRSAAAFGAAAVITQDRNAPEETGGLAKAASGALETMPLLRAVNIARTIIALKAANVWCIGLDAGGAPLSGPAFADRRVALVLGAEGEGLRRLTRETCDEIAGLAIKGAVESLNVSAAASVALYELSRR